MERILLKMGDKRLLQKSESIDWDNERVSSIIQDMLDTMDANGGVGIAAPQIGELVRVTIIGFEGQHPRYPEELPIPKTVMINPVIHWMSEEKHGMFEGCLSVPKLRGFVMRPNEIIYSYVDLQGTLHEKKVKGFHARIIQHEVDHLDGILFPMRVDDLKKFGFEDVLEQSS